MQHDGLVQNVPCSKGNRSGSTSQDKPLMANPGMPTVCFLTSLFVLLCCKAYHDFDHNADIFDLFDGTNESKNFSIWLKKTLGNMSDVELTSLGATRNTNLGTHSGKKGALTFASSVAGACSIIPLLLRADSKISGAALSPYFYETEGSAATCGKFKHFNKFFTMFTLQ